MVRKAVCLLAISFVSGFVGCGAMHRHEVDSSLKNLYMVKIIPETATLRETPSSTGRTVLTVGKTDELRIYRCEKEWCEVEASKGGKLWIESKDLQVPLETVRHHLKLTGAKPIGEEQSGK